MKECRTRVGGTGHWGTYLCRTVADIWHYGHLPPSIVHGEITRGEVYGNE